MAYWPRAKLGPLHRISQLPSYIFLFTVNVNCTTDKELEMLVTAGHNEEKHGREELPADISWIVITRELNNKRRKL